MTYERTYDTDIYAYISDNETEVEFCEFENVGGNSYLADDHFTIHTFKGGYCTFADEFESKKEFVDFMVDCYNVEIPFDEFTYDDGTIDYGDCAKYIKENFAYEYDIALGDLVNETWDGAITNEIMDRIEKAAKEEEED